MYIAGRSSEQVRSKCRPIHARISADKIYSLLKNLLKEAYIYEGKHKMMKMRSFLNTIRVLSLALLFCSCTSIKDQQFKDQYLPDLKVKNVKYSIYQHEIISDRPERPRRIFPGLLDIELNVTIENIGSGDWNSDLCILCTLDENRPQNRRLSVFENLIVPFASKKTILLDLKDLFRRPNTITINLNPTDLDSMECDSFSEENFYNNNLFKLDLRKSSNK